MNKLNEFLLLKLTFDGVAFPVVGNLCCSEAASRPVVVHRGQLEAAELGEELRDVGLAHPKVQVGHQQFTGATWKIDRLCIIRRNICVKILNANFLIRYLPSVVT